MLEVDRQVRLAWAKNQDGRLVHISDVQRGKKCGCVCPACEQPLIAKPGKVKQAHFAHKITSECRQAPSLARIVLNLLGQQALRDLEKLPTLHLPPQMFEVPSLDGAAPSDRVMAKGAGSFTPDRLVLPEDIGLADLPVDFLLEGHNGLRLGLVLHGQLSDDDIAALRHAGIPTLCYDLEMLASMDVTREQVIEVLSNHRRSEDGYWLFSRIADEKLSEALEELDRRREALRVQAEVDAEAARRAAEKDLREQQATLARQKLANDVLFEQRSTKAHVNPCLESPPTPQSDYQRQQAVRNQLVEEIHAHIAHWIDDTLMSIPNVAGGREAALSEAQQGAWARLQTRLPVTDSVWEEGLLSDEARKMAEEGAADALRYWLKRQN